MSPLFRCEFNRTYRGFLAIVSSLRHSFYSADAVKSKKAKTSSEKSKYSLTHFWFQRSLELQIVDWRDFNHWQHRRHRATSMCSGEAANRPTHCWPKVSLLSDITADVPPLGPRLYSLTDRHGHILSTRSISHDEIRTHKSFVESVWGPCHASTHICNWTADRV